MLFDDMEIVALCFEDQEDQGQSPTKTSLQTITWRYRKYFATIASCSRCAVQANYPVTGRVRTFLK